MTANQRAARRPSSPGAKKAPRAEVLQPLDLPARMAPTDALFWYAESALPIFRPIIGGLYILDRQPNPKDVEAISKVSMRVVPRLRERVVEAPAQLTLPEWVEDRHLDLAYHVRHVCLPRPGSMRDLLDLTAAVFATPLDRERPLWESYWIEGLEGGRSAFFFKLHHSVVDGVGSRALLKAMTQPRRDSPPARVARPPHTPPPPSPVTATARWLKLAGDSLAESARLAGWAAAAPLRAARDPVSSAQQAWKIARGLRGVLADASSPVVVDPLARSTSGLSRRLDVMDLPLQRLRAIKEPLGVTINDLILAVLAGTLGEYHRERRAPVQALNCMVPMNLRSREDDSALGNRVGTLNIVLPVGERRPDHRLERIVRQTRMAKSDRRGALYPFLVQTLTVLPGTAFRWLARQSLGRVNVACTNVPGLAEHRYVAGAEIEAIYPFASVVEGTPVVMALFSYGDHMNVGIDTDPEAVPEPHRLTELFLQGLDEMEALARTAVRISD